MRRRKSSINVSYHTKSVTWNHTRDILESLEVSDLKNAATLSRTQNRIDDSRIQTLLNLISRTCTNLNGSDERKSHLFVDLKSSIVFFGLPIIFLTLNPGDNYSPLSLFYAGEQIDPMQFEPDLYPYEDRVRTLLGNPQAVVEYFHTLFEPSSMAFWLTVYLDLCCIISEISREGNPSYSSPCKFHWLLAYFK